MKLLQEPVYTSFVGVNTYNLFADTTSEKSLVGTQDPTKEALGLGIPHAH